MAGPAPVLLRSPSASRRRRAWGPLALAMCMVTGACSGDDGSDPPPSTTSTTAPASTLEVAGDPPPVVDMAVEPGLVIGFAGPPAGLLSRLAVGQWRGVQLAIEDINAVGGVLDGLAEAVRVDARLGQSDSAHVGDLEAAGAHAIIGPVASAGAASFIDLARERSSLACSASATSPSVTSSGDAAGAFFRTALRDDHWARHVAESLVTDEGSDPPERIMVIGRDDVYGNELTIDLVAELGARGADVLVEAYPPRRVTFAPEAKAVAELRPDRVVMVSFGEAPRLLAEVVNGGYPAEQIVGLHGFAMPTIARQAFPSSPERAEGLTVMATAGDRALLDRLAAVPANDDQLSYGAQAYDCTVTLALAAAEARSTVGTDIYAHVRSVTAGGRRCSSFGDCAALLAQGEDIDFDGATGGIAIDESGDITSARVMTSVVRGGDLLEVSSEDIDLRAVDLDAVHAAAVFAARVQQLLRILGYLDRDATGVFDDETVEAIRALQRDLGLPETGEFDAATEQALRVRAGALAEGLTASVADIQRALADAGFYDGPIDGQASAATIEAVRALQRSLGVPDTGFIDGATLRAIHAHGAASTTEPPPTEPPTTEAPATEPPATEPSATQPPATQPPATEPLATEPPASEPPATQPVPIPPPATDPPATEPPATEPAATEPPRTEPAATEPPATDPPATTAAPAPPPTGMLAVLAADPRFSRLVELLTAAGYTGDLGHPGRLTLFAPTNAAFASLPPTEDLVGDLDRISAVLAYHLVEGNVPLDDLAPGALTTVHGADIQVARDGSTVFVDGARIADGDIPASNGVIHVIDQVLTPPA